MAGGQIKRLVFMGDFQSRVFSLAFMNALFMAFTLKGQLLKCDSNSVVKIQQKKMLAFIFHFKGLAVVLCFAFKGS